ncbi:MAG: hypothetical protein ACPGTO_06925 [Polaribacter sp.]
MSKDILRFTLSLLVLAGVLFGAHLYILHQFEIENFIIPVWQIYIFNAIVAFLFYAILRYKEEKGSKKSLQTFLVLTFFKIGLAIVFLLPLFLRKSTNVQTDVFNFFIPYFLFLTFEIFSIQKLLQKT